MNEMNLFIENEKRKMELLKSEEYQKLFLIKVIEEWKGHWFKLGEMCIVRKYPFKATKGGTTSYCHCKECRECRENKELYDMYEVVLGEEPIKKKISQIITTTKIGAIIPVDVCKIIKELR